jgi:hypothetical protein
MRPVPTALLARGAMGMAIAASVAAVSLLLFRTWRRNRDDDRPANAAGFPAVAANAATQAAVPESRAQVVAASAPPSYTTPVDDSRGQRLDGRMVNYVVAHRRLPLRRCAFSPLSTMNSSEDLLRYGGMTAAEIGAYR